MVETIWFDDILDFLPKNNENKNFEKAILKIDIEGFEPFAFMHAEKLFDSIEIPIIFMEWYEKKDLMLKSDMCFYFSF